MKNENYFSSLSKLTNFNDSFEINSQKHSLYNDVSNSVFKSSINPKIDTNVNIINLKPYVCSSVKSSDSKDSFCSVFRKDYLEKKRPEKQEIEVKDITTSAAQKPKQIICLQKKPQIKSDQKSHFAKTDKNKMLSNYHLKKAKQNTIKKEQLLKEINEKEAKRQKEKEMIKKKVQPIDEKEKKRNLKLREKFYELAKMNNDKENLNSKQKLSEITQNEDLDKAKEICAVSDEEQKNSLQESAIELQIVPEKSIEDNEMFKNISCWLTQESINKINNFYSENLIDKDIESFPSKTLKEIVDMIWLKLLPQNEISKVNKNNEIKTPQIKRRHRTLDPTKVKNYMKAKEFYKPRLNWMSYFWKGETNTFLNLDEVLVYVLPEILNN